MTGSTVETITVYSENAKFYLRSIPYDNESPSLRGVTHVYQKGIETPLYSFERGFDSVEDDSNNLALSNDGQVIFYVIPWGANEEQEGLRSVTVYRQGKVIKSFTESEITGCDLSKERCDLVYSNYKRVVDEKKSNFGSPNYKRVFKPGVDEKEKFLSDFPIFSFADKFFIVDSKKQLHTFDLITGNLIGTTPFNSAFDEIRKKVKFNKVETTSHDVPIYPNFPKLKNGVGTTGALEKLLGMKTASIVGTKDDQYRIYQFNIDAIISRDGKLSVEKIEIDDDLPKEKILNFFASNRFSIDTVPLIFPKWHFSDYFYFRNSSDILARKEKAEKTIKDREELKKRLVADTVDGKYIPKDLGEAFLELDKLLPEIDKKEMSALTQRKDMIKYHMGLGLWIRNNWGLWGGSRLQKYFTDKGIDHPDDMSSVIIFYYWEWLQGRKELWREWETNPSQKIFE